MIKIRLDESEVLAAATGAVERRVRDVFLGRNDNHNFDGGEGPTPWGNDIIGALAEFAAAKHLGIFWEPRPGILDHDGDVGDKRQVRATHYPTGKLILHDADPDDHKFLLALVLDRWREVRLVGWVYGEEGKREEFWADPRGGRPAYFVPQNRLRPLS